MYPLTQPNLSKHGHVIHSDKKTTSQEDNLKESQPHRKITSHEDNLTGSQPYRKTASEGDNHRGRQHSQEDSLTEG